jgi:ribosome modulation factor
VSHNKASFDLIQFKNPLYDNTPCCRRIHPAEYERVKHMDIFRRMATSSTIVLLLSSPAAMHAQYAPQQAPPPPGYGEHGGWDNAPSEYNEAQRRGYQDGIVGARKDYENHRQPNVNNRDEYRHPDVPKDLRHEYREGFERGYDAGVRHMMGEGPDRH